MTTHPAITIRPLAHGDKGAWARLWTGYLEFYNSKVSTEVYDMTFSRLLSDNTHEFHGRVAEMDGQLVGLVHFLFHRHCWRIENTCYLQDLYADPSVRGMGIGRKLIEAVYKVADTSGAPSVYWTTQQSNTTAQRLYDRIGTKTDFIKYQRPA